MEQPTQACSGQPTTPGSKKARYTISCRRLSKRSSRLALPLGPSNLYSFPTASHGIRRRSAASASRARVNSFSFTRSSWCAAFHSCGETTFGVFMPFFLLICFFFFISAPLFPVSLFPCSYFIFALSIVQRTSKPVLDAYLPTEHASADYPEREPGIPMSGFFV